MANVRDFSAWLESEMRARDWRQKDLIARSGISSGLLSQIRLQSSARTEPLILVDEHGTARAMNRHVLRRLLKRIGDRAGIKNVHPHRLRHSFATHYLRNGGKMIALQELLGHSDLEMVRRYAKFVEADIAIDHAGASPADKLRL